MTSSDLFKFPRSSQGQFSLVLPKLAKPRIESEKVMGGLRNCSNKKQMISSEVSGGALGQPYVVLFKLYILI